MTGTPQLAYRRQRLTAVIAMTDGFALSTTNAGRSCDVCGDHATAYLHGDGFRCGDCCPDAPDERPGSIQPLDGGSI